MPIIITENKLGKKLFKKGSKRRMGKNDQKRVQKKNERDEKLSNSLYL